MTSGSAYRNKAVLVTGSSRGIGRLVAEHFLSEGAQVVGISRGSSNLKDRRYVHVQLDISDPTAVQGMFQQLHTSGISVDIVVNNAAVLTSQYAMIMPAIAAQQMVNVNLLAPFYISREAAKSMRRKKWGRIINMGSMAERLEPVGDSVYAACKAGLITMGNVLAKEFATFNITCNTLGITAYQTEMLSQLPQDKVEEVLNGLTLPGYAEISDILNVIDFFSSDRSSNITAQTVYLGGVT